MGYNLFYTGDACERSGVKDMKDTWWGKVIDYFGGELLVSNSWSGSRVTKLPQDVIIIYLGINDWVQGVKYGNFETHVLTDEYEERFDDAYGIMLHKLCANYPDAEIWCCI